MSSLAQSRGKTIAFFAVVLALAGIALYLDGARRPPTNPLPPPAPAAITLDAVPAGAMFLATLDVAALKRSPVVRNLGEKGLATLLGDSKAICGFEPLQSIDDLALAIPDGGGEGDFGIVATGPIDGQAFLACGAKIIQARGGAPIGSRLGTFDTVRDPKVGKGGSAEIAVRSTPPTAHGPLIVGAGSYLRAMIDAADGVLPSARADKAHTALRAAVSEGSMAVFSIVFSAEQRQTLADEIARSGGRAPAGLGSMLAASLGAKLDDVALSLHAVILVSDEAQGRALAETLDSIRKERAQNPALREVGIGALLGRIKIQQDGTQVHLRLSATIDELTQTFDRLSAPPPAAPPAPLPAPAPSLVPPSDGPLPVPSSKR